MRNTLLILHIISVGTWIGASITVTFLSSGTKSRGDAAWKEFMGGFEKMSERLYPAATIGVAITGVWLVIDSNVYDFEHVFVIGGIAVVISGIVLGTVVFTPLARRVTSGDVPEGSMEAVYRRFAAFGTLDIALLILAISLMVTKAGV